MPIAHLEHVHAALADDEVRAHQIGRVLPQPLRATPLAGLFVGSGGENQVAAQLLAGIRSPSQVHEGHRRRRELVLHVESPAAPHVAILHQARERRLRPVRRLSRHHVQVTQHEQRRALSLAGQPGDAIRKFGEFADERRFDAVVTEVLLGDSSGGGHVSRRVARVSLDQPREQPLDLIVESRILCDGDHTRIGRQIPP